MISEPLYSRISAGKLAGAHLGVVDGILDHLVPVVADAETLGGVLAGLRRHLHQPDGVGMRAVALVERAFGARHRIDHAVLDRGLVLLVRGNADVGKA